jgi:large subunit ribosomal protein L17
MLRNLASSLILTERDAEFDDNQPQVKGRIVTTIQKAKEVRPLVEKCVTIARRSLAAEENARQYAVDADRGSDEWKTWRKSDEYQKWNNAIAPALAARRRALKLLGDKQAVQILFAEIAPRMVDRNGGYTRVLRVAKPRVGDAGVQALLEFVGTHDRVSQKSERPTFVDDSQVEDETTADVSVDEAPVTDETVTHETVTDETVSDDAPTDEQAAGDDEAETKED